LTRIADEREREADIIATWPGSSTFARRMLIASPEAHGVTVRRNSDLGLVPSLSLRQLWEQLRGE
jgi:hypothetical protein